VLKVVSGGSSIGTLIVEDPGKISPDKVSDIFKLDSQAVVEELIVGQEITIPVLDKTALPVIEIIPPENEEFDYQNKYNGRSQEICPPNNVPEGLQKKAQLLAEKVHQTMGARHLSRVDIMIDKSANMFVLEINTIPGLTDQSLYPKSAAVAGLTMPQLVTKFAKLVRRDFNL
jgi:D-alanine--D-alanine ligase